MVIFHSYVSLPEGIYIINHISPCEMILNGDIWLIYVNLKVGLIYGCYMVNDGNMWNSPIYGYHMVIIWLLYGYIMMGDHGR